LLSNGFSGTPLILKDGSRLYKKTVTVIICLHDMPMSNFPFAVSLIRLLGGSQFSSSSGVFNVKFSLSVV